jgi:hypothetical protein
MNLPLTLNSLVTVDDLFRVWKSERPDYVQFSNDGILLEEVWSKQEVKIAFILKEPNDGFFDIRGRDYNPKNGNSRLFWRNLNIWSYTVSQFRNGKQAVFEDAKARKEDKVGHIAYVNLKKKNENLSTSCDPNIQEYVDRDWEFISRQLGLINPDFIFCCGTYKYLKARLQTDCLGDGLYRLQNKFLIDFCHPSARYGYKKTFERLSAILKNLPSQSLSTFEPRHN